MGNIYLMLKGQWTVQPRELNREYGRAVARLTVVLMVACLLDARPASASAADVESALVGPRRYLTLNGRPLSDVVGTATVVRSHYPFALVAQQSGHIRGMALDEMGQPVVGEMVQLRHIGPPIEVVATVTTDANGRFSFAGLRQGRYIADLRRDGHVVATSGLILLADGGVTFTQVGGIVPQEASTDKGHGREVLFWTAVGAGVGAGLGVASVAGTNCSLPENLCPVAVMMGSTLGALGGLMFGLGR